MLSFGAHTIHQEQDFKKMREAGLLAADTLDYLADFVKAGVSTLSLDQLAADFIHQNGARSACLNYNGFPKHICISVNDVACHGIPSADEILKEGDIVNIDVTVLTKEGYHGDHSINFLIGQCTDADKNLVQASYEAMINGVSVCQRGVFTGAIGYECEQVCQKRKVNALKSYCGHGIGKVFHGNLMIPAYGKKFQGEVLLGGYFFTIEPILTQGKDKTKLLSDKWTVKTTDSAKTSQFEHTVGITLDGKDVEIFTVSTRLRKMMALDNESPVLWSHAKKYLSYETIRKIYDRF